MDSPVRASLRALIAAKLIKSQEVFPGDDHNTTGYELPFEIVQLSNAFPMGPVSHSYSTFHLFVYLPPEDRVLELVDSYYRNAART